MNRFRVPFKSSQPSNRLNAEFVSNSSQSLIASQSSPQTTQWAANAGAGSQAAQAVTAMDGTPLRSVRDLPAQYVRVFSKRFPRFNYIQSKVFEDVIHSDQSIALCAPTGSGKTVVFEMAIIRELIALEDNGLPMSSLKALYMAPLKKLVDEKYEEFKESFQGFGLKCLQLTGDSDTQDYQRLRDVNILLTTPEKWDSMIRSGDNCLTHTIQLMVIDEIHSISDDSRGATMEAVISRMKTLRAIHLKQNMGTKLRFIAASATAPNVEDIAQWLDPNNSVGHNFADVLRPVRLQKIVMGYPCKAGWNDFRFDIQLSYKLDSIIRSYSDSKPTLIFCSTRKSVLMTAESLSKSALKLFSSTQKTFLSQMNTSFKNNELRNCVKMGIGFHHSGLDKKDRETVERLFTDSRLPVLVSTTTLAMGVNLPAHLVIVKNTVQYAQSSCHEYPETQILQMIGRAGRPKYDTSAVAVIMTKEQNKWKYECLLNGTQIIESHLHKNLVEQLNAEIALQTVTSFDIAVDWIRSTFLFIRVLQNPSYYGSTVQMANVEQSLQLVHNWCRQELTGLSEAEMISTDEQFSRICSTSLGKLMARHCISLKTMKTFCEMTDKELGLKEMIESIAKCEQIVREVQLRVNEKKILNEMNQNSNRFALTGKIKSADMKINCLIQLTFGSVPIADSTLNQESLKIMRTGQRMSKCLAEVMFLRATGPGSAVNYKSLTNALILNKCFKAKLWHDSTQVAKQLNRIGNQLSKALVDRGFRSFNDIKDAEPRDLEFCLKRHPPFGSLLIDEVRHLPYYSMTIEQNLKNGLKESEALFQVTVKLENYEILQKKTVLIQTHFCYLIVGNDRNELFYCVKVFDSTLMRNNGIFKSKQFSVERKRSSDELSAHLISDSFVGLDVECRLRPQFAGDGRARTPDPSGTNCAVGFSDMSCEPTDESRSEGCQHKCLNKSVCRHLCCKKGLSHDNSQKTSQPSAHKQVTKSKRQENSTESSANKRAKLGKREAIKPKSNLDDWLQRYKKKTDDKPESDPNAQTDDTTESVYFKDKTYSEISDIEGDSNDQQTDGMDDKDWSDYEFDEEFERRLESISCAEDFQQFERTANESIEQQMESRGNSSSNGESMGSQSNGFSLLQWGLYLPSTQVKGKTFFTPKYD